MDQESLSQGERTKSEITQVAYRLFLEQGYHGTSMWQIAQKSVIALGGIYNHFESKEQIFTEVIVAHHAFFEIIPALNAAKGETVEEFVRDVAGCLVSNLDDSLDFLKLMFIELVEFNGQHIPQIFDIFFPEVLEFAQRFTSDRSELRNIPAPILVRAFIGMFFSFFMTEILIGQFMPPEMSENILDYFVDIYLHGVLVN